MRVVAIIQARMGSTRLPGKIMKKVLGKPLLEYQIERVRRSKLIDDIIIATTKKDTEQPIINLCKRLNISYFRGSENNVLSRYYEAAQQYKADAIVRLTSDCPIIDPDIIDTVVGYYKDNFNEIDYVSNTLKRTYPRGYDTEIFSFLALENAYLNVRQTFQKEHVTPYIYQHPNLFRIDQVLNKSDQSNYRFTVDTQKDFLLIEKIINHLYIFNPKFTNDDIINLLNKNNDWLKLNSDVVQRNI